MECEGHAEKYPALIDGGPPKMNRSAKGGVRSSLHYGGEGVLIARRAKVFADGTVWKNSA